MAGRPHPAPLVLIALIALTACGAADPRGASTPPGPPVTRTPIAVPASTPTPAVTPTAGASSRIADPHGVVMVFIPAGEFTMGSDQGSPDELPIHKVSLDAYYIDLLETTNQGYQACVDAGGCTPPFRTDCCSTALLVARPVYYGNPQFADYPVTWLSWTQAKSFCEWRGARLPAEAEWEKAARGTDARTYPWGNEPPTPSRLNFTWNPGDFNAQPLYMTARVGSYPAGASPYGVLDMAGNVYEWVADVYDPGYYAVSPDHNPTGPAAGKYRIARGGSFYNQGWRNRSSNRNMDAFLTADVAEFDVGVRCARSAGSP